MKKQTPLLWKSSSTKICKNKNRVRPCGRTLPKTTDKNDMYTREFPSGNFLDFFFV